MDYLDKFELIKAKLTKLEPFATFSPPKFLVTTELKVDSSPIASPFGPVSALGGVERIIGRLQPYLYMKEEKNNELGLVAINTKERTVIGKFNVVTLVNTATNPAADNLQAQEPEIKKSPSQETEAP